MARQMLSEGAPELGAPVGFGEHASQGQLLPVDFYVVATAGDENAAVWQ